MHNPRLHLFIPPLARAFLLLLLSGSVGAQLPTAAAVAAEMTVGWNLGNSLEVPDGETAWGNPATTKRLVDSVSRAGFNVLRIPSAWNSYADQESLEIDADWLARVKEVVDYGIANDMYIILNSHWDGGWLEEQPVYTMQAAVNEKQLAYWTQIANYFKDYGERLLFAGTNEVRANYGTPTVENIEVQESYNQTFVTAVRATGGNNASRSLIVQTYNTNIGHGLAYFTLPEDPAEDRLFVEVHYYDPYNFTLDQDPASACTVWGQPWADGDVCTWGQEAYTDDLFGQVNAEWVAEGVPVILGEFGVGRRSSLTGSELTDHLESREYYLEYVVASAVENGMVPIYWDNGYYGDNGFALFNRTSGAVVDAGALNALLDGAGGTVSTGNTPQDVDLGVALFPNPFPAALTLRIADPALVYGLRLTDAYGRNVGYWPATAVRSSMEIGEGLPVGVYLLSVLDVRGTRSLKVVKSR